MLQLACDAFVTLTQRTTHFPKRQTKSFSSVSANFTPNTFTSLVHQRMSPLPTHTTHHPPQPSKRRHCYENPMMYRTFTKRPTNIGDGCHANVAPLVDLFVATLRVQIAHTLLDRGDVASCKRALVDTATAVVCYDEHSNRTVFEPRDRERETLENTQRREVMWLQVYTRVCISTAAAGAMTSCAK